MMPTEPVISVRGEATLEVEPEIAAVWVTVLARNADRRRAVDLLAERSRQVATMLKGFGDAVEKLESGRVSVWPEFKDGRPGERVTGYVAQAGISATIGDFAVLGEIVTGLAGLEMVALSGPDWQLRVDSPVRGAARLAAAKDAVNRAREYAAAFGGSITGLTEAADTGLLAPQRAPVAFAGARAMHAMAQAADQGPPEFDFEPAKLTVSAQIEARFTMTAPQFGG